MARAYRRVPVAGGSHSVARASVKGDASEVDALAALAILTLDQNRNLIARIPFTVNDQGTPELCQSCPDPADPAAVLRVWSVHGAARQTGQGP